MATTTITRAPRAPKAPPVLPKFSYERSGGDQFFVPTLNEIREYYHKVAHETINKYLGPDPTKYVLLVDGSTTLPIEAASLTGSGIVASNVTDEASAANVVLAFKAAMSWLRSKVPASFKRSTGYYAKAGGADFFTIRLNGRVVKEGEITNKKVKARSNIQIYSKARYAAPLESIHRGRLLLGARNAAAKVKGVNASFTYAKPTRMGQVEERSKKTNKAFTPLAVPMVEIGSELSNVTNYIGNIEINLERNRKRPHKNLVERKILKAGLAPRGRELERRIRKTSPKRR